jgi:hypothetical protein
MLTEKVFEIGGEGGGICISRQTFKTEEKFLYDHGEFDPTDEGLEINEKREYQNFAQPFQLINDRYPWYKLHVETVHDDYKNYIIEKLIEKLNEKSIKPDFLRYSKNQLEQILRIELKCKLNGKKAIWSCTKTNE